jgi:hypothetical protein
MLEKIPAMALGPKNATQPRTRLEELNIRGRVKLANSQSGRQSADSATDDRDGFRAARLRFVGKARRDWGRIVHARDYLEGPASCT